MGILRHFVGTFRGKKHPSDSLAWDWAGDLKETNFEEFFRAFVCDMWVKNHQPKEYLRNVLRIGSIDFIDFIVNNPELDSITSKFHPTFTTNWWGRFLKKTTSFHGNYPRSIPWCFGVWRFFLRLGCERVGR